jgi:rRNA-processing protein FCF1
MVVFDTCFLALAFDSGFQAPLDPSTGQPLTQCVERINHLISTLSASKQRILIPTPVLAEYLVEGGPDKDKRLQIFGNSRVFSVAAFDQRAAIECAMIEDGDSKKGRKLTPNETKAKVKFDRQVIAVAKAHRAHSVYTGDVTLAKRASENGINAILTWEVPLPPAAAQLKLGLSYGTESAQN